MRNPVLLLRSNHTNTGLLTLEPRRHQGCRNKVARGVSARLQVFTHTPPHFGVAQRFKAHMDQPSLGFGKVMDGSSVDARLRPWLRAGSSEHFAIVGTSAGLTALAREQTLT